MLLVGILHIALIFLVESRHDGVITFRHAAIDVFRTLSFGIDGLVDGKLQRMPDYPFAVSCPRHDVERAVDGKRKDGNCLLYTSPSPRD